MTLSVLDVQRAMEARGVDEVRWMRVGPSWVLTAYRTGDCGGVGANHAHADEAWRRLFAALDADVDLPRMDTEDMNATVTVPSHSEGSR